MNVPEVLPRHNATRNVWGNAEINFLCIFAKTKSGIVMTKKILIFLSFTALVVFLPSSCVMYHPHNVDIPLLQEPGEMQLDATVAMSAPLLIPTANISYSYAPFKYVGMEAAANLTDWKNYHLQGAVGSYQPYNHFVLEEYLGLAYGYSHHENGTLENNHRTVEGPYRMFFSQINAGGVNLFGDNFDAGVGIRTGIVRPDWCNSVIDSTGAAVGEVEKLDRPLFVLEPQAMVRFGWEHFMFSFNFAFVFFADWPTENNFFNYDRFSMGLGFHFKF